MASAIADSRRVLLVYPRFPATYWGMQYSLPLYGKKSSMPPLGLITIAALTPPGHEFRLVDLNCGPLSDGDLEWADVVCFSAMLPQRRSLFETAARCRAAGKLVVFGGPFPTACPGECAPHCDVLVLNEGEVTWPAFLEDLRRGAHRPVYESDEKPDVTRTPVPRFDLLRIEDYGMIPIQFSRGCPFQCEFCDIIVLFGRRPRTKTPAQVCAELDALHATGYRGLVFIVDDNFIGNKREVRRLLPELRAWNDAHGRPFGYGTEASVDLADDPDLLREMVAADFHWVFVGIETPSIESLRETLKHQNTRRPLLASVRAIQEAGLMVHGGFIIGFDSDTEDIFDRQVDFITRAAIPGAMVGLLVALPGTPLYRRMREAGRLREDGVGGTSDQCGYTNIVTRLPARALLEGYRRVIASIYTPRHYFARSLEACRRLPRPPSLRARIAWVRYFQRLNAMGLRRDLTRRRLGAWAQLAFVYRFFRALPPGFRRESLRFAWSVLRTCPEQLPGVPALVFLGAHFCRFSAEQVLPEVDRALAALREEGPARAEASDALVA